MKEKKLCLVCGCEFEPKNKKGVYCSSICRQKDYRRRLVPIVEMGRRVNPATPEQLVALHNAEFPDQHTQESHLKYSKPRKKAKKDELSNSELLSNIVFLPPQKAYDSPRAPKTLDELRALCPEGLDKWERAEWIRTERQKYGI